MIATLNDATDQAIAGPPLEARLTTIERAVENCAVAHGLTPREVRYLTGAEPCLADFALAFERMRLQQIA